MKIIPRLLCFVCAVCAASINIDAAQIERPITFALTGFAQSTNRLGDSKAVPFRFTTKDVLFEIGLATQQDFTGGALIWIESLDDTNAPLRIVVRKGGSELDLYGTNVTFNFFDVVGAEEAVVTERFLRGTLKGRTFYAIDQFVFSTLGATNDGRDLTLQGFSKESQAAYTKTLGGTVFTGFSSSLTSDVNGELSDAIGLLGPVKGRIKVGSPKFVPTPVVVVTSPQRVMMEIQHEQAQPNGQVLPPLPPSPSN